MRWTRLSGLEWIAGHCSVARRGRGLKLGEFASHRFSLLGADSLYSLAI